jgi:hypothetical protein
LFFIRQFFILNDLLTCRSKSVFLTASLLTSGNKEIPEINFHDGLSTELLLQLQISHCPNKAAGLFKMVIHLVSLYIFIIGLLKSIFMTEGYYCKSYNKVEKACYMIFISFILSSMQFVVFITIQNTFILNDKWLFFS